MKLLFELDRHNYDEKIGIKSRPSARGIIFKDGKLAMVYSKKYQYYKFPGGGIEKGEEITKALIREVREESGLIVKEETIKEFGLVIRRDSDYNGGLFYQDNYYYTCEVEEIIAKQKLDNYEDEEGFTLSFVTPEEVIKVNKEHIKLDKEEIKSPYMLLREAMICELLIKKQKS